MEQPEHEVTYTGPLYVRPVGRGIVLEGTEQRLHLDDWMERALREAGVLDKDDAWIAGGRTTESVTLKLTIERTTGAD